MLEAIVVGCSWEFLRKECKYAKSHRLTPESSSLVGIFNVWFYLCLWLLFLRPKLGNYINEDPWFAVCVSVRCWYLVFLASNLYVSRVSCSNCFNVIYYGLYFICLFLFSIRWLCVSFMLIYYTGTARRVIYFEYTDIYIYIYCTCAGCIIIIVYILISLCSTPSAVLPFPREPNLERSVVIIGGARPQFSNFAWETFPAEVSRSWAPFKLRIPVNKKFYLPDKRLGLSEPL